ncbi:rho GTPase activating protein 22 [Mycena metata]|uniref:Rho GTPase activating protein 22 n=1 Tax=Mycena metata TaxID=1033252 RepID=A0AAD7IPT3_9AGAR|nr:rho GTPase activating protein 22 [Mycena metata]
MPKPSSSSLQPPVPTQAPPTPSRAPLAQLLTRPSKWFSRSVSAPRVSSTGDESPRPSTSSLAPPVRKPKISRPTDPRPILDVEGYMGVPGSRSVLDLTRPSLSLTSSASSPAPHAKSSLDLRYVPPPSPRHAGFAPSAYNGVYANGNGIYPSANAGASPGNGDLRTASRRGWSQSVDDLRSPSPFSAQSTSSGAGASAGGGEGRAPIRVNTNAVGISFVDKVAAYRGRADSVGPTPTSASTASTTMGNGHNYTDAPNTMPIPIDVGGAPAPFYARRRTDSERSARSARSGRSGVSGNTGGGTGSPGSTPPSARVGTGAGMAWPAIGSASGGGVQSPQREVGVNPLNTNGIGRDLRERERNGSGGGSPVSISISAPVLAGMGTDGGGYGAQEGTNGHVHTRSHSFTPKLSSRLAAFGAASPARKGSAGELDALDASGGKEKEKRGVGFPFHFGGGGTAQSKSANSSPNPNSFALEPSPLLAPPHIIEPTSSLDSSSGVGDTLLQPTSSSAANDDPNGRRASQIVYAAGFVNRLITPALADPRAWKAFKMEVRGTKLVLHKPPGDRAVGVRELFPVGVVEDEDDGEAAAGASAEDVGGGQRRDVGSVGRKKRAYWGRGRHPALGVAGTADFGLGGVFSSEEGRVVPRGQVEKGTLEALVHELVFATVFLLRKEGEGEEERARREEQWREYALAVLFCLPLLADRARVEAEFIRCAGYLVAGAPPEEIDAERVRVAWMATEYLRLHGAPADPDAWEDFRADTLPDVHFSEPQPATSGMPASVSTQAMYAPSPVIGTDSPALGANTFSPRPDNGGARMLGLLDALGVHELLVSPSPATPAQSSPRAPSRGGLASRMPWAALAAEGLTREVLLILDANVIARSLTLFHRAVLEQAPDNPTAAFVNAPSSSSPLFGSDAAPHWLTKLLLVQILGADTSSGMTAPASGAEQQQHAATSTSRTHSRSEVISVWARVGELCRLAGDECTWRAIGAALCSAPVARLNKVWLRVDAQALAAVEGWARLEEVEEPRVTPWGGDIRERLKSELDAAQGSDGGGAEETLLVAPMERALDMFEGFRKQFLLCPRRVSLAEDEVGEDVKLMVNYWKEKLAEGGASGGIAAKFVRVDQFFSLSLAAEPRRKGLFEPHYWTRAASQTPNAILTPLLFPEIFPTSALVDRDQILRGRVDSDTDPRFLRLDSQLSSQPRMEIGGIAGLTQIPVFNGELLLNVWHGPISDSTASSRPSSRLPSRPSSSVVGDGAEASLSRAPSVRVKPGSSQGLDRKTSVARRNSLPSPSQRRAFVASEPSSEPPLRVRVAAGNLHQLVQVLVHGLQGVSVSVADDNGEMSLREGKTRELVVDQVEFSKLWWNVYRSLVSPLVFFELLRKMYIQMRPRGPVPSVAEFLYVAGSRTEVLDTIKDWLTRGGGAQDILDDPQLHSAVRSFLDNPTDHVMPQSANSSDPGVEQAWGTLTDVRCRLRRTFDSHTMRPPAPFPSLANATPASVNGQRSRPQNQTRDPPDIDRIDPEELVDNLDAMACAAFGNVTQEDLFVTSDLLETQTADRIGWFLPFAPSEETVEIQNLYSYLQDIEPSPLISLGVDSLYRSLPPGIRSCIRAYVILRKWTISQLVAPRLGLRARQSRMELILRAIEVTRLRNIPSHAVSAQAIVDFPCPRSFVEAVLTSAVLSVESRIHTRPWLNIAIGRGAQCDSIASLLSVPTTQAVSSSRELTVDVGWFLERMLEIISAPDVIESQVQQDTHSLINFDKRRHLCNLIVGVRKGSYPPDVTRRAFERLNNIEKDIWQLQFDHRGIKEEAQREGAVGPGNSPAAARRAVRPFQKTIAVQVEKNRRDRTLRARLHKERVHEQTKNEKREDLLNKAMMRKQPSTPQQTQKHQRGKKSMSAFLHFMRPISSAFGNESVHPTGPKRTAEELDFVPSGKPSLVVSLVSSRVAQFINNDRSFLFQVQTEDGGSYVFQAVNKREMLKWVEIITRVTQTTAKRRLTYLGNPKPQLADHLNDGPASTTRDPYAVFGVDLDVLLRREVGSAEIPPGTIPSVIERLLSEIETRGLTEVGIYRLAGATSAIAGLKDAFNRGEDPLQPSTDIHAVCDLVKSWFRVLPVPLFPGDDYQRVIDAMQLENLDDRLTSIRTVVQGLPRPHFDLLKRVSEHLDRVADFEESNQMTAEGLAIVFSPNLLRPPRENFSLILANMAHTHKLVKALITHFHVIFDEGDVDAEGDGDGEDADEPFEDAEEGYEDQAQEEEEEPFPANSPTHLDDVAEGDESENDLPPTIHAELDQSPLDFNSSSYTLPP